MFYISEKNLKMLRNKYKKGDKVKLIRMDDSQAPPIGTIGTVIGVDDMGSILVKWSTGSSLSIIYGEDSCQKV